ncbi:MAG: glycosyltransferase family 4 protein [Desulfobacteraceae bacterium]|nr:glycosyltransferase [Desulfobacteraceae bacterium]MBC2754837.1 glycosyltransferase family 4 protein [Desulfobacteraceae bacterium]
MRIASFAKYLPAEGWDPYVLTLKDRYLEEKDINRLDSLDGVPIFKAGKLVTIRDTYLKIKLLLNRWRGSNKNVGETAVEKKSKKVKIKHFISSLAILPDDVRNWIIPATFKALRILSREKIDTILTSCPPYSVHLVGLLVAIMRPKVKWIADFRDPWMVPIEKNFSITTSFSNSIDYRLERYVIQRADLVLTTTKILAETFIDFYTQCQASKFKLIPNGFDGKIVSSTDKQYYDSFTISYTGVLYFGRTPEPVFQAVASLIKKNKIAETKICIKLVGHCRNVEGIPTFEIIKKYGLESVVEVIDPVPHAEAQKIIMQSHVALLLAPDQPYQIPAKTYEYMGLGTPILAITGEGATADLIHSVSTGKAVHPENVEAIEEYILEMIKHKDSPERHAHSFCKQYTRKSSAQKLAQYINRL